MADKRSKDDPPLILNPRNQAEKRINSILRFKERQRRNRVWINFLEIVEWLAEERGDRVNPLRVQPTSEMPRAYDMLLRGLLDGDFAEDGRWVVRYLNPHVREEKRMTRAFLLRIIEQCTHEGCTDEEIVHHHLSWCWIPRRLFKQWLIRRGLPSPPWFEPREATQDDRGESKPSCAQPSLLPSPEPAKHEHQERSEVESKKSHKPSLSPKPPSDMRRRGPEAKKLKQSMEAMRRDIQNGVNVRDMLEKDLEERYSVSRTTARDARNKVLSKLNLRQTPTNDN